MAFSSSILHREVAPVHEARTPRRRGKAPRRFLDDRPQGRRKYRAAAMTLQKESNQAEGNGHPAPQAEGGHGEVPVGRGTLPPPEWSAPRSVSGLALEWLTRHAPI